MNQRWIRITAVVIAAALVLSTVYYLLMSL